MVHTSKLYGRAEFGVPGEKGIITCFGGDLTDQEIHNHLKIQPGDRSGSTRHGDRSKRYGLVRYRLPGKGKGQITCIGKGRTKKEIHSFLRVHHPRVRQRLTKRRRQQGRKPTRHRRFLQSVRHHERRRLRRRHRKSRRPRRPLIRRLRSPLQKTMETMRRRAGPFAKRVAADQAQQIDRLERSATKKLGALPRATVAHVIQRPTPVQSAEQELARKAIAARALTAATAAQDAIEHATKVASAEVKEQTTPAVRKDVLRDLETTARKTTKEALQRLERGVSDVEHSVVGAAERAASTVKGTVEGAAQELRSLGDRLGTFLTGSPTPPPTVPEPEVPKVGGRRRRRRRRMTRRKREQPYYKRRSRR